MNWIVFWHDGMFQSYEILMCKKYMLKKYTDDTNFSLHNSIFYNLEV